MGLYLFFYRNRRVSLAIGLLGLATFWCEPTSSSSDQPRVLHAKELLGSFYKKSVVKKAENINDISPFVQSVTKQLLPIKFQKQSKKIANTIVQEAKLYELDPLLIMAMIQNESSFNPKSKGSAGEIGLFQLKPSTAAWIAGLYEIDYTGEKDLLNPVKNIQIGAAYLDYLRDTFEQDGALYLAAFNMGANRVKTRFVKSEINPTPKKPKEYAIRVMRRYFAFYSALTEHKSPIHERALLAYNKIREVTRTPPKEGSLL